MQEKGVIIYTHRILENTRPSFVIDSNRFAIPSKSYIKPEITHWLDISKLTTIEAAKELANKAFIAGEDYQGYIEGPSSYAPDKETWINNNIKNL